MELALDHPYRGLVAVFIDRADGVSNEELWAWLRNEHLPGAPCPGPMPIWSPPSRPIALEVDAPGDVPREAARDNRTVLLWFLNTPPRWRGSPSSPSTGASSKGRARAPWWPRCPFIPTIVGTDTYTDKLWTD